MRARNSNMLANGQNKSGCQLIVKGVGGRFPCARPSDFGYDLEAGNRIRDLDPARQVPLIAKCVERSRRPPTDGFKDRPCVRLGSAE